MRIPGKISNEPKIEKQLCCLMLSSNLGASSVSSVRNKGWNFALFKEREATAVRSSVDQRAARNQSPS